MTRAMAPSTGTAAAGAPARQRPLARLLACALLGASAAVCAAGAANAERGGPPKDTSALPAPGSRPDITPNPRAPVDDRALDAATIRQSQQALAEKGHRPGAADGVHGRQTREATRRFQQAQNLEPTGELDARTLSALGVSSAGQ